MQCRIPPIAIHCNLVKKGHLFHQIRDESCIQYQSFHRIIYFKICLEKYAFLKKW